MQELEKIIEALKYKAIMEGKETKNRHIKDYDYGKVMAYNDILNILEDLEG